MGSLEVVGLSTIRKVRISRAFRPLTNGRACVTDALSTVIILHVRARGHCAVRWPKRGIPHLYFLQTLYVNSVFQLASFSEMRA